MLLKIKNLKFTINIKHLIVLSLSLLVHNVFAQEIIEETKEEAKLEEKIDFSGAKKIDGVAAVVGEYIILDSDVDKSYIQLEAQGVNVKEIERCQLFGKLLEDKLYAHHAVQDSIVVSPTEINRSVEYQIQQFLQQTGGDMKKLLEFYKKDDEQSFRQEIYEINKNNMLAQRMQSKIVNNVEVTPEEVRLFFNKIPKDELPTFGTELKVAQIVIEPKVTKEEKQKVIDRLSQFKKDVEAGSSFRSKAILYGEDPGLKQSGYIYTLNKKKPRMVKEFRQAAFSLQEGQVSEPFETDFGIHIVYLQKIRGQEYDVSHILIKPKVSNSAMKEAKEKLERIRKRIVDGEISFAEAAKASSDEKETRANGGQLINPETQDYNFELTRMDPELYAQIQDLKGGAVSPILLDQDRSQKKKFKILTVTDRIDEHQADFSRDFLKIKQQALNEKKIKAVEKWQKEKIIDTYVKITGSYRDCEFSSNWLKK